MIGVITLYDLHFTSRILTNEHCQHLGAQCLFPGHKHMSTLLHSMPCLLSLLTLTVHTLSTGLYPTWTYDLWKPASVDLSWFAVTVIMFSWTLWSGLFLDQAHYLHMCAAMGNLHWPCSHTWRCERPSLHCLLLKACLLSSSQIPGLTLPLWLTDSIHSLIRQSWFSLHITTAETITRPCFYLKLHSPQVQVAQNYFWVANVACCLVMTHVLHVSHVLTHA